MRIAQHPRGATHPVTDAPAWFAGRIADGWFTGPPSVTFDGDEIVVVGTIPDVELDASATDAERATARGARVSRFREDTREARVAIAREAEHRFDRKVSWGVDIGDRRELFTVLSSPVMTRLRMNERRVLDTLIDSGVARSRSEALAWCVRLVAQHQEDWLQGLRDALTAVERVRGEGPEIV
ncbi:MAG TPA: hypothetical protein VFO60_07060 [Candidatus Dormibacteraeota bacterium]|nr:hypothetical protein [Candidatus Dormibacteraeota bacterium]